jgi:hypothetical protein
MKNLKTYKLFVEESEFDLNVTDEPDIDEAVTLPPAPPPTEPPAALAPPPPAALVSPEVPAIEPPLFP